MKRDRTYYRACPDSKLKDIILNEHDSKHDWREMAHVLLERLYEAQEREGT